MATIQFLPFAGVSQIPSSPVMRTPVMVPETPFNFNFAPPGPATKDEVFDRVDQEIAKAAANAGTV